MTAAHAHLSFSHAPVFAAAFGSLVFAYGYWKKCRTTVRASLYLFILTGIFTFPVFFTGSSAAEMIEMLPLVEQDLIHDHLIQAGLPLGMSVVIIVVSLTFLLLSYPKDRPLPKFIYLPFILAIITMGLNGIACNLGGKINHPEVRHNFEEIQRQYK